MGTQLTKHPYKYKESKDMIGSGAFGKTYRAKRSKDGEFVAIHVVNKDPRFTDPAAVVNVAGSIIRLSNYSPNLLRCTDFFDDKSSYYIVVEWCSHGDLGRYLREVKPFPITKIDISLQIVEGLNYLHSQLPPLIHAHLKPENILIHVENYKDIAKVTDYGFTTLLPTCENFAKFFLERDQGLYCPPEYFLPTGKFSPAVDVYSLGLILYMIQRHTGNPKDVYPKTERHERFSIDFTSFPLGKLMTRDITNPTTQGAAVTAKGEDSPHVREIIVMTNEMLHPCPEDRTPVKVIHKQLQVIAEELNIRPREGDNLSLTSSRSMSSSRSHSFRGQQDIDGEYITPSYDYARSDSRPLPTTPANVEVPEEGVYVEPIDEGFKAQILYDYTPNEKDELTLRKGEYIDVKGRESEGWWIGQVDGKQGLFPANYVKILPKSECRPPKPPARKPSGKSTTTHFV